MPWRVRLGTIIFAFMAGVGVLRADWTAVASTGTIDESDLAKIALNTDGSAEIRSTIASTSAKIRYNVVAIPDLERLADPNLIRGGLIFSNLGIDNSARAYGICMLKTT